MNRLSWFDTKSYITQLVGIAAFTSVIAVLKHCRVAIGPFIYCQRTGIEEIFEKLICSGIITICIVNQLILKRNITNEWLGKQYLALYQTNRLEIKNFLIICRYGGKLKKLVATTKRKNSLNKQKRALFKQQTFFLSNCSSTFPRCICLQQKKLALQWTYIHCSFCLTVLKFFFSFFKVN